MPNNFRDPSYHTEQQSYQPPVEICKLCRHQYLKTGGCSNPDCDNYIPIKLKRAAASK